MSAPPPPPGHEEPPDTGPVAVEQLRQSEERFRLMVEAVADYAIFMLDANGRVVTWNLGAERIKGFTAADIIGRHISTFYPQEAVDRGWPDYELKVASETGRFEDEGWRVRKDGSQFWANVIITALFNSEGRLEGFAKVTRDLTERRMAEGRLREAYADLETRVHARTAELAAANEALSVQMAERERLAAELRASVEQLRQADENKNQFLAILAHELRNPLAPIRTATELVRAHRHLAPALSQAWEVLDRQVLQMKRLVDDLLDVSRITRGTLQLTRERVELRDVVRSAVETSRPILASRGHRLTIAVPDEPVLLDADLVRLAQVLANLLNNAAKFTPAGGHVQLTAERVPEGVVVRVRDDGVGIAPEKLPRIFEMFTQVGPALDRAHEGLGIGLTLARRLVELHGGRLEAASAGLGQGSEFSVRLPVTEDRASADPGEPAPAPGPTAARRILIVDDNRDSADALALLLSLAGHAVEVGYDGDAALQQAETFRPEVAILDIGLPRLSGYEVARRIRAASWGRDMVLVAMTGWGQEEDKRRARAAGFDQHLTKPVDPAALGDFLARGPSR